MSTIDFPVFESESELRAGMDSLFSKGREVDELAQGLLYSAAVIARDSGNVSLIGEVLDMFPRGSRVDRAVSWLQSCMPIFWDKETGKATLQKGRIDTKKTEREFRRDRSNWNIDGLAEIRWYDFEKDGKDKSTKVMDVSELRKAIAKFADGKETATRIYSEEVMELAEELLTAVDAAIAESESESESEPEPAAAA